MSSAPGILSITAVSRKESNVDKSHTFSNNSESDEVSLSLPAKIEESPFEENSAKSDKSEESPTLRLTV